MAVGIDHCREGWCAAAISGSELQAGLFSSFDEIPRTFAQAQTIWVDMPVGLVTSDRQHRPEPEARRILGRRSCTLFNAPCRQALAARSYTLACEINQSVLGRRLSRQSYGLFPGIREVDVWCRSHPEQAARVHESHPELCFGVLAASDREPSAIHPLQEGKHSPEGQKRRIALLKRWFPDVPGFPDRWLDDPRYRKARVDLLDALVLALCGYWSLSAGVRTIPEIPGLDDQGLPMRICLTRRPEEPPDRP